MVLRFERENDSKAISDVFKDWAGIDLVLMGKKHGWLLFALQGMLNLVKCLVTPSGRG